MHAAALSAAHNFSHPPHKAGGDDFPRQTSRPHLRVRFLAGIVILHKLEVSRPYLRNQSLSPRETARWATAFLSYVIFPH